MPILSLLNIYSEEQGEEWNHQNSDIGVFYGLPCRVFSSKNTNFDNHPQMRELLWKSRSLTEKYSDTFGAKTSDTECTKEVKREFHFICIISPQRWYSSVWALTTSTSGFSHRGKWELVSEHPVSSVVQMADKEIRMFLTQSRITSHGTKLHNQLEESIQTQNDAYQSDMDPTNCFTDYIRKPAQEPLGMLHLQILLNTPCASPPHTAPHNMARSMYISPIAARVSLNDS